VAIAVVALPSELVNLVRNRYPLCEAIVVKVSVVDVAQTIS